MFKNRLPFLRCPGCFQLVHYTLSLYFKIWVILFCGNCGRNLTTLPPSLHTWFTTQSGNDASGKKSRQQFGVEEEDFFPNIRWSSQGINACVYYNTVYQLSVETILRKGWHKISVSTNESLHVSLYSLDIFCHNHFS